MFSIRVSWFGIATANAQNAPVVEDRPISVAPEYPAMSPVDAKTFFALVAGKCKEVTQTVTAKSKFLKGFTTAFQTVFNEMRSIPFPSSQELVTNRENFKKLLHVLLSEYQGLKKYLKKYQDYATRWNEKLKSFRKNWYQLIPKRLDQQK